MEILTRLEQHLLPLAKDGICIAFSGGVDSALLLQAACAGGGTVHAVTLRTPFHSVDEHRDVAGLARGAGAVHTFIDIDTLPAEVLDNPPDRCYLCKRMVMGAVQAYAREHGLAHILDGTNADDLGEYRPGLRALGEFGVKSPLAELGFQKSDVRRAARELGMAVSEKPSAPCLATRFPYDTPIDMALLRRVECVEETIKELGIAVVRARVHGDTVRLEVATEHFGAVLDNRQPLLACVRDQGFARLTLDLAGYRSGSFDDPHRQQQKEKTWM